MSISPPYVRLAIRRNIFFAGLQQLYIYACLNRVQSSHRLEREVQRNVELMWLTERLSPDHKTISDFRKDNSKAIRAVCREFVVLCRCLNLFAQALVVIDGSKLFRCVDCPLRRNLCG